MIQFYVFSNSVTEVLKWIVVSIRQQLVSKILMNAADSGIIAAKKNHNLFHSGNCIELTLGLFVFGKIGAQEQHVLRHRLYEISV